jgi:hypothetical protein
LWWTVLALGAVLVFLSALADQIGIGNGDLGWKQVTGIVAGGIAVGPGLARLFFARSGTDIGVEKPG